MIKLENVEKYYGSERVLGPVSLSVGEGEIVGIVGENGAGKSTLLRMIAGVEKPDRGSVRIDPMKAGEVGYVPQELALYQSLTGMQNLRYWATAIGLRGKRRRIRCRHLLDLLDLSEKADKPVSTYSGGMKRRLNLGCALVGDVKLLLLDEPTVGADTRSTELIWNAARKLQALGCAIILVSHHAEDISRLADRVITLNDGVITGDEPQRKTGEQGTVE